MFSSKHNSIAAYRQVAIESDVSTADPHKLIQLLFDGARAALAIARTAMQANDIPRKGAAISQAIRIIDSGLRASLDLEQGGDLAAKLDALYDYMSNRLLHANLKNDLAAIDEVNNLLAEIQGAWAEIRGQAAPPAAGGERE